MESHLFTIAPHGKFLDVLADRVLDGTLLGDWPREGAFWLSDVTIVLPTRRARLALAEAFARRGHLLLPDIRTFGGEETEEEPFLPTTDGPALPHAAGRLERRLKLAEMTSAAYGRETSTAEVLALADTLGEVIDDLHVAGILPSALRDLEVSRDLAANWLKALKVLEVVLVAWPERLAERGKADPSQLRNLRLRRQAAALPQMFGDRPVIAAGSTGSIPATADLLRAIARLPRGALVLPGLDTSLDAETFAALQKPESQPHGHPQYGLVQLVQALGSRPGLVEELAPSPSPRTTVLNRALALAENTAVWAAERDALAAEMPTAAEGLTLLAARTEEGEARAIALATRDAVASKRTVGIVTPDRNLARRIAAELNRFGIDVDDSAGTPLFQSPAGRLVRQVLAAASSDFAPVDTVALLRNRAVTAGHERGEVRSLTDALDYDLRGKLLKPGIEGLKEHAAAWVIPLLDTLAGALAPLQILLSGPTPMRAAIMADAVLSAVRAIASVDALPGGPELVRWAEELAVLPNEGPTLPPVALDAVLMRLMAGYTVRSAVPRRDDVYIWGRLEARLQSPDLMILAGLNEDVWPEAADPGPWLSRGMRLAVGLEPPERRHGLAAHDFLMAAGNAEVIIAWADRIGGSPVTPSRLVQRLEAFLGADVTKITHKRGKRWIVEAQRLDATGQRPRAAQRPMPRPPVAVRPKRLSVTEIEKLFRSPYDIYARHVLHLRALDPLGQAPGGRERGNLIHDVFAQYIEENLPFDASAVRRLSELADETFSSLETIADRRDIWLRRFIVAAGLFVEFERSRHNDIAERHAEIKGEWKFPNGFTLVGKADRVDIRKDGSLEILDFKTGAIPAVGEMQAFMAPQLLLEAAMAQAVGIDPVKAAKVAALTYIKIGSGEKAYRPEPFRPADDDLAGAIDESARRLQGHVDALLLKDTLPMAARVIPDAKQRFRGEFDHLARTEEWLVQEDEDLF
jgi:ATP-dependent helicase/nuclease subunit B